MNKFFIVLLVSGASVSGVYWFTKTSAINETANVISKDRSKLTVESRSNNVIAGPRDAIELNQAIGTFPEPTSLTNGLTASSGTFVAAYTQAYQRDMSEVVNDGEFEDADDVSYQRDDSEVINVGEFVDADLLESTF